MVGEEHRGTEDRQADERHRQADHGAGRILGANVGVVRDGKTQQIADAREPREIQADGADHGTDEQAGKRVDRRQKQQPAQAGENARHELRSGTPRPQAIDQADDGASKGAGQCGDGQHGQ